MFSMLFSFVRGRACMIAIGFFTAAFLLLSGGYYYKTSKLKSEINDLRFDKKNLITKLENARQLLQKSKDDCEHKLFEQKQKLLKDQLKEREKEIHHESKPHIPDTPGSYTITIH